MPLKSVSGVYVIVLSLLIITLPWEALASVIISESLSGSVSLVNTLITTAESSAVIAISSLAMGGMFSKAHVKLVNTVPPLPSSAVMVTLYGSDVDILPATVPLIIPVTGSTLNPSGNPEAVKFNTSPSMSVKLGEISKFIVLPSASA